MLLAMPQLRCKPLLLHTTLRFCLLDIFGSRIAAVLLQVNIRLEANALERVMEGVG
jgi:hypothetical protein